MLNVGRHTFKSRVTRVIARLPVTTRWSYRQLYLKQPVLTGWATEKSLKAFEV